MIGGYRARARARASLYGQKYVQKAPKWPKKDKNMDKE